MILRIEEVVQVTGLSKATIYRRIRDQQFPPPVKLGGYNPRRWLEVRGCRRLARGSRECRLWRE